MIFNELKGAEPIFKGEYFKNMVPRFINASLSLEGADGDYSSEVEALDYYYNTKALEYAFDPSVEGELNNTIITDINNLVTAEAYSGFRKGPAEVMGSNVRRSRANMIYSHMNELLYDYREDEKYVDDPFFREAKFHIKFLHIHPFGDGNGRTARVILIKNLCYQGLAPCIITKDIKDKYNNYIENSNFDGMAELFKERSEKEKRFMVGLYGTLNDSGLIEGSKMTESQAARYREISSNTLDDNHIKSDVEQVYPLRNADNLISLFKFRQLPKSIIYELECKPIHSMKHHIYDSIIDTNSGDEVLYNEKTKSMTIKLVGVKTFYKIYQVGSILRFAIDGIDVNKKFFEKTLRDTKIKDSKKVLVKTIK